MDEDKQVQASPQETQESPITIEEQKLQIERERLKLEIRKERTTKLQLILPLAVSMVAILSSSMSDFYRTQRAQRFEEYKLEMQAIEATRPKEARIEVFRKLTEKTTDPEQIQFIYDHLFPNDDVRWDTWRKDVRIREGAPLPSPP